MTDESKAIAGDDVVARDARRKEDQGNATTADKKKAEKDADGLAQSQQGYVPNGQTVAPLENSMTRSTSQDSYSAGMAAYRARSFAEATRQFDAAASNGDLNAAWWAAQSVRDASSDGCVAAVPRFDSVTARAPGAYVGNQAMLDSARCQITLGQLDPARVKLARLVATSSHGAAAQQALNDLNRVASQREAAKAGTARGGAARPSVAAPAPAPARAPATSATESGF